MKDYTVLLQKVATSASPELLNELIQVTGKIIDAADKNNFESKIFPDLDARLAVDKARSELQDVKRIITTPSSSPLTARNQTMPEQIQALPPAIETAIALINKTESLDSKEKALLPPIAPDLVSHAQAAILALKSSNVPVATKDSQPKPVNNVMDQTQVLIQMAIQAKSSNSPEGRAVLEQFRKIGELGQAVAIANAKIAELTGATYWEDVIKNMPPHVKELYEPVRKLHDRIAPSIDPQTTVAALLIQSKLSDTILQELEAVKKPTTEIKSDSAKDHGPIEPPTPDKHPTT